MIRRYDWEAVQAYYDDGHTLAECKARFGFCNGAWYSAVGLGEIVPKGAHRAALPAHNPGGRPRAS
jgi:hypothetical protein